MRQVSAQHIFFFFISLFSYLSLSAQVEKFEGSSQIYDKDYIFTVDLSAPDFQLLVRRTSYFEKQTEGLKIDFQSQTKFEKLNADTWKVRIHVAKFDLTDSIWKVYPQDYLDVNFSFSKKKITYQVFGKELAAYKIPDVSQEGWSDLGEGFTEQEALEVATDYFLMNYGKIVRGSKVYTGVLHKHAFAYAGSKYAFTLAPDQSKKSWLQLSIYQNKGVSDHDISLDKMLYTTSIEVLDSRKKDKKMQICVYYAEKPNAYSWRTLITDKLTVKFDFAKGRIAYSLEGTKITEAAKKIKFDNKRQPKYFDETDFYADDAVNLAIEFFVMRFNQW